MENQLDLDLSTHQCILISTIHSWPTIQNDDMYLSQRLENTMNYFLKWYRHSFNYHIKLWYIDSEII